MTTPDCATKPTDADLMAAVRLGRVRAYGVLFARHAEAAHRFARRLTGCQGEATELVTEAFLTAFTTLHHGPGLRGEFAAYLRAVIADEAITRALHAHDDPPRHHPAGLAAHLVDHRPDPADWTAVTEALARLPARWQQILRLTVIDNHRPAELADQLGLTPNAVAALAWRAREGLRRALLDPTYPRRTTTSRTEQ